MRAVWHKLDDSQDEIVGFIERIENLVAGDGDSVCAADAPLHLDEAQAPGAGYAAFDVVIKLFRLASVGSNPRPRSMSITMSRARATAA